MRRLWWLVSVLLVSVALGCGPKPANTSLVRKIAAPTAKGTITWLTDPKAAFAESKSSGKPVLLDMWQIGCANCEHLDKDVWPRADISDLAKQFVTVKVNGQEKPELGAKYAVSGYPTTLFLTAEGKLLGRVRGEPFPEDMLSAMQEALKKAHASK